MKINAGKAILKLIKKLGFCDAPNIIDSSEDEEISGFNIEKLTVDKSGSRRHEGNRDAN